MPTAPTAIRTLPDPPDTNDAATFDARADAYFQKLRDEFSVDVDAAGDVTYDNAVDAAASAVSAAASEVQAGAAADEALEAVVDAGEARDEAAAHAATALAAPGTNATALSGSIAVGSGAKTITIQTGKSLVAGMWVLGARTSAPLTTWVIGQISAYNSGTGQLDFTVGANDYTGTGTHSDWTFSLTGPRGASGVSIAPALAKSADYSVVSGDLGKSFDLTASGTLSLLSVAGTADGSTIWVRNTGTGRWLIDPNGAETIDGRTSMYLYPGEGFAIIGNTTAWRTFGRSRARILISSATVSVAAGQFDFETGFDDTEFKRIVLEGLDLGVDASQDVRLRVKKGGSYLTTGYVHTIAATTTGSAAYIPGVPEINTGGVATVTVDVLNLAGTVQSVKAEAASLNNTGTNTGQIAEAFNSGTTGAMQGLRAYVAANNIDAGTFNLYGYR